MKNNKKQTNLNLKQKIILTNLLILAPIIIFIFIITYNALSKNLITLLNIYLIKAEQQNHIYLIYFHQMILKIKKILLEITLLL